MGASTLMLIITVTISVPLGLCRAEGMIKNVNTIEDFKNTDKNAMLKTAAQQVCCLLIASPNLSVCMRNY